MLFEIKSEKDYILKMNHNNIRPLTLKRETLIQSKKIQVANTLLWSYPRPELT